MRQLAIAVLAIGLATTTAAQAQTGFGASHPAGFGPSRPSGFVPPPKSAARPAASGFGPAAPQSYKPHAAPSTLNPPGNTDGGKPFKPFKGTSTYEGPGAFKPYKPPKMKSVYDH